MAPDSRLRSFSPEEAMMGAGGSSSGSMSTVSKGPPAPSAAEDAVEKAYGGLSEESSSCYPRGKGDDGGDEEDEEEEELELGLSLGAKKATGGGGSRGGAQWREYCRILTAEDFPSLVSRASPLSSSSSVSSSGTLVGGGTAAGAGSRRAAASGSPEAAGSANPPQSTQTVVGWPPIRSYRMNSLVNQSKDNTSSNAAVTTTHKKATENNKNFTKEITAKEIERKGGLAGNSLFVKVNMDGDPIGRKVDVNAHQSYETLAVALEAMFHKSTSAVGASVYGSRTSKLLDGSSEFALTYEDRDGDWMLVGDVPWGRMFLSTVKRLRIMRTSDTNGGLAPRLRSSMSSCGQRNVP